MKREMKRYLVIAIITLFFLAACKGEEKPVDLQNPFLGGATGLVFDFQNVRKDVFDGGRDPFDIVVKIENKGESHVPKNKVRVKLSGINPAEFGKLEEQLVKSPDDDVLGTTKDPQGAVLSSPPAFVEFTELNHFSPIVGAKVDFTLRADVCYKYKTQAVSKVCVRSNILNPEEGGLCEINEQKAVFNSGSPVQVANLVESARAKDKIGFVFEVRKEGPGDLFEKDSTCDRAQRNKEDKVFVKVDTKLAGVSCTGLTSSGSVAQGFVTLFENTKLVSCTQPITSRTNFEQLISVEVEYDYEDFRQTTITVKSSGESINSS